MSTRSAGWSLRYDIRALLEMLELLTYSSIEVRIVRPALILQDVPLVISIVGFNWDDDDKIAPAWGENFKSEAVSATGIGHTIHAALTSLIERNHGPH